MSTTTTTTLPGLMAGSEWGIVTVSRPGRSVSEVFGDLARVATEAEARGFLVGYTTGYWEGESEPGVIVFGEGSAEWAIDVAGWFDQLAVCTSVGLWAAGDGWAEAWARDDAGLVFDTDVAEAPGWSVVALGAETFGPFTLVARD